jgi:hypothetical protein
VERSVAQALERAGSAGAAACRLGEPRPQLVAVCGSWRSAGAGRAVGARPGRACVQQQEEEAQRGGAVARRAGRRCAGKSRAVREELQCDGCGRFRTGATRPRVEDVGGHRGEGSGRHGPDAGRPRPSRR